MAWSDVVNVLLRVETAVRAATESMAATQEMCYTKECSGYIAELGGWDEGCAALDCVMLGCSIQQQPSSLSLWLADPPAR